MKFLQYFKFLYVFRLVFHYRVLLVTLAILFYLLYNYYQPREITCHDFASISTSKTRNILDPKTVIKSLLKSPGGFLAATRTNRGQISPGSSGCIVDPAIRDCTGMGFSAFLLRTLDHIRLCHALGSDNVTVLWRACNSVCSWDPRVNSWEWYFEPVNRGLETQVERVVCPVDEGDMFRIIPSLNPILDNSFKDRTGVEGYEDSKIITVQERMSVNNVIQQYVKPNARITEKVRSFYHQYLAGLTVLGVQVRGTDHWMETSEQRLPPLVSWVKSAKTILESLPRPRKIFIASDNDEIIDEFVRFFGNETVSSYPFLFDFFRILVKSLLASFCLCLSTKFAVSFFFSVL